HRRAGARRLLRVPRLDDGTVADAERLDTRSGPARSVGACCTHRRAAFGPRTRRRRHSRVSRAAVRRRAADDLVSALAGVLDAIARAVLGDGNDAEVKL